MERAIIYELKLKQGAPMCNVYIRPEAPPIPGFIAICSLIPAKSESAEGGVVDLPATTYINVNEIEQMTISNYVLEKCGTYEIIHEQPVKVRIDKSI